MPKFSVIITTYNRQNLLPMAIESVLSQIFNDWELIIIDDGSTDNTSRMIRQYEVKEPRILYYSNEVNHGVSWARNKGIEIANGDFVIFLDSDDIFKPTYLEFTNSFIDDHYGRDTENLILITKPIFYDADKHRGYIIDFNKLFLNSGYVPLAAFSIFDKRLFDKRLLRYDEKLKTEEDIDLSLQAIEKKIPFIFLNNTNLIINIAEASRLGHLGNAKVQELLANKLYFFKKYPKLNCRSKEHFLIMTGIYYYLLGDKKNGNRYLMEIPWNKNNKIFFINLYCKIIPPGILHWCYGEIKIIRNWYRLYILGKHISF